jgi:hypothetical protein
MSSQLTLVRTAEAPESLLTGAGTRPENHPNAHPYRRFFFWLFLVPALLYLLAIPLVRLPSYERWGPSKWGPMLDFAWKTQGVNADMVIFGDSSAFLGIDPRLVDRQLHIKSVVLPNTVGSLPINGDQALEYYLAHNSRPRIIVLYFTAWDLDYAASTDSHLFEGEEMLLRHDTPPQIAVFARRHPVELLAFPLRNYSTVTPFIIKTILHDGDREARTAAALGHADDRENYPPVSPDCNLPTRLLDTSKDASVQALAQKYRARGYNVVVYLAPVPACSNASQLAKQTFHGLAVAPPATLPPPSFKQDGFYAHVEPDSVPAASRLFAETMKPLISGTRPASSRLQSRTRPAVQNHRQRSDS